MAVSGVSTTGLNFTGLATGIDTQKIIDGLTAISQKRIDAYKSQQSDLVTKQTAFAALQGKLFDLQSKTNALARSGGGAFDGRVATASDSTAVTAVAGTAAVAGTYSLKIQSLAQAAQTASGGYADPNTAIKQGTLTVQVGTGTATTVTVDGRNNTLQGLADSVNAAGGDVRASVVNDGSGATPYRLLLTSAKTGAANAIAVTNNLTTGPDAAIDPAASVVQAASDARVSVGTGAGALTVTSDSNQVNNLIPGVSLNLLTADPARTLSVTVKKDSDATVKAVQDFADSYNAVQSFLTDQTKFDATTQTAGLLLGNNDVAALRDQLAGALSATIPGLSTSANRLSSVGLAFGDNNTLTFDAAKLSSALAGQGGVTPPDFKSLFALSGTSDNPGVSFLIGGTSTKPTGGAPYVAQVTTPAGRAVVVGSNPPTVVSGPAATTNLQVKLNGLISTGITIPAGPYSTVDALLAEVQKAINAAPSLGGGLVSVGLNGDGKAQITTQKYGSAATVAVTGGSPELLTALGFSGTESGTGTDVAGSFLVNGVTESAAGSGQVLIGAAGNANTDGLQVTSTLAAPGSANVSVTQGLASRLGGVLTKFLDPTNGRLKAINDGFDQQNKDISATITKQNTVLADKTADLQAKFAAMETAVNKLKGIQTQLSTLTGTTSTSA